MHKLHTGSKSSPQCRPEHNCTQQWVHF